MPSGTGQAIQLGVQPTFVVANLAAGGLLYKCTHLDTGNGAMLAQACADAIALSPDAGVVALRGTYNLRSAGAPATPIALPGGGLRGEGRGITVIQSKASGDMGVFTNAAGGSLKDLTVEVQEPTAAGSGSTIAVDMGTSANADMERVTVSFIGTLNATEAGNLVLRTGVRFAGRASHVRLTGDGWKLRAVIAADFTGFTVGVSDTMLDTITTTGFDISGTSPGGGVNNTTIVGSDFDSPTSNCLNIAGVYVRVMGCSFRLTGGAVSGAALTLNGGAGAFITQCAIDNITTGAGTHRGIVITSSDRNHISHITFGDRSSGVIDVGVAITNDTCVSTQIHHLIDEVGVVTNMLSDGGVNTTGRGAGMTWRGTFTAGAGATTAYAGMGEAAAEMAAGNAQKLFPAFPGYAFRLRVQVITNSMPAATSFTVMLDAGATGLVVVVGAGATGQFDSNGGSTAVQYVSAAVGAFSTWDLRCIETGVGTIVFSATLELI